MKSPFTQFHEQTLGNLNQIINNNLIAPAVGIFPSLYGKGFFNLFFDDKAATRQSSFPAVHLSTVQLSQAIALPPPRAFNHLCLFT
jgi:hypothetical protein